MKVREETPEILRDMQVPLARDTAYCADAASWSLQRALNPLGVNAFAVHESSESSVWNAGVSAAVGFYQAPQPTPFGLFEGGRSQC